MACLVRCEGEGNTCEEYNVCRVHMSVSIRVGYLCPVAIRESDLCPVTIGSTYSRGLC
jgi:hypothetical protein